MKKLMVCALGAMLAAMPALARAKDVTVGMSWNQKESSLETAWEDYFKSEAIEQGKAAGVNIIWTFNVAAGDPTRQAANIEDMINKGVDIVMARAEGRGGHRRLHPRGEVGGNPVRHIRPRFGQHQAHGACRRRQLRSGGHDSHGIRRPVEEKQCSRQVHRTGRRPDRHQRRQAHQRLA